MMSLIDTHSRTICNQSTNFWFSRSTIFAVAISGQVEALQEWFIAMPGWIELSGSCFGALVEAEREASCTKAHRKDKEISCSKHGGSVVYRSLRMLLRNVKTLLLPSPAALKCKNRYRPTLGSTSSSRCRTLRQEAAFR